MVDEASACRGGWRRRNCQVLLGADPGSLPSNPCDENREDDEMRKVQGAMTRRISLLVVLVAVPLTACGSKWSPACKTEATLTAPFTELNLPVGEGRVCESNDKKVRLELQGADKDKWRTSLEQAVTGAGFAKESCPSYCMYTKGTQRLQVIVGSIGTKWVSASLIMSTGRDTSASAPPASTATPATAATAATGGKTDLAACSATLKECTPACNKDTACINRCLATFKACSARK